MLCNNYRSRNLIGHYPFWVISPRNLTLFTRPFLARRHVRAGHETRLEYGHIKLISCFWSVCGSISSELLDLRNQYSACSHSVDTTCTQWLTIQASAPLVHNSLHFVVLSPDNAFCCLYTIFFPLWFPKKKKPGAPGHF